MTERQVQTGLNPTVPIAVVRRRLQTIFRTVSWYSHIHECHPSHRYLFSGNVIMNGEIDTYLHIIGGELLVIFAIVQMLMDNNGAKRVISKIFLLMLGFMLTHLTTHILPNKIAGFIYSSHHEFNVKKSKRG